MPLTLGRPGDTKTASSVNRRPEISDPRENASFRQPDQGEVGGFEDHLSCVAPKVDGACPSPTPHHCECIIKSLPGGCAVFTDAIRMTTIEQSSRHQSSSCGSRRLRLRTRFSSRWRDPRFLSCCSSLLGTRGVLLMIPNVTLSAGDGCGAIPGRGTTSPGLRTMVESTATHSPCWARLLASPTEWQ
jgi:hypothetical protein